MQNIKFRQRNLNNGSYYYWGLVDGIWQNPKIQDNYIHPMDSEQYIDLKDKNDIEIYEGDILHYKGYFHHIVSNWRDRGKSIKNEVDGNYPVKYEDNTGFQMYHLGLGYYKIHSVDVEVIGNIYENPELLEFSSFEDTKD